MAEAERLACPHPQCDATYKRPDEAGEYECICHAILLLIQPDASLRWRSPRAEEWRET